MRYVENEIIGKRLQKVRESIGAEYYDMAKLFGVSEGHYRKIERGMYSLDMPKLLVLYNELNVDPLYLMTGKTSRDIVTKKNKFYITPDSKKQYVCEVLDYCKQQICDAVEV